MQIPAPVEYAKATSVEHALALLGEPARRRGCRRRAQPDPDDEAAAGPARTCSSTSTA